MALAVRITDEAEFVHVADPDCDVSRRPADWLSSWLPATGQPVTCTRVRVRPLSRLGMDAADAARTAGDDDAIVEAYWAGVVSIDGERMAPSDVALGPRVAIVGLVMEVSRGLLGPLGRCA